MALGIVGATVMPHNLYLHSSISQSRKIDRTNPQEVATAVRFATWDSNIQLSAAFVVNCLLLIFRERIVLRSQRRSRYFSALYDALQNSAIAGAVASPALSVLLP